MDQHLDPGDVRRRIRAVWSEVLGVPSTAGDTFFDLGGHSIAAFRILAKTEAEFGAALDVAELFEDPTADEFADQVTAMLRDAAGNAESTGAPAG